MPNITSDIKLNIGHTVLNDTTQFLLHIKENSSQIPAFFFFFLIKDTAPPIVFAQERDDDLLVNKE